VERRVAEGVAAAHAFTAGGLDGILRGLPGYAAQAKRTAACGEVADLVPSAQGVASQRSYRASATYAAASAALSTHQQCTNDTTWPAQRRSTVAAAVAALHEQLRATLRDHCGRLDYSSALARSQNEANNCLGSAPHDFQRAVDRQEAEQQGVRSGPLREVEGAAHALLHAVQACHESGHAEQVRRDIVGLFRLTEFISTQSTLSHFLKPYHCHVNHFKSWLSFLAPY
jgi:hypothetical protein